MLEVVRMAREPEPGLERLLEVQDVLGALGVSKRWLYQETRAGRFPHVRLAGKLRFRREDVEAYIREHLKKGN